MANNSDDAIRTLEEDQIEILLRMSRIYQCLQYWNSPEVEQRYIAAVVSYLADASRRQPQTGVAKRIADFVAEAKVKEDTGEDETSPNVVACLVRDGRAFLACNYFKKTDSGVTFQGWGDDAKRDRLRRRIVRKFEGLSKIHLLEPTGQGRVKDAGHANRECHAEMQLLKFSEDRGWPDAAIRTSKAPCLFCFVELWRSDNESFPEAEMAVEADTTMDKIVNWIPPEMIHLKMDGVDLDDGPPAVSIEGLKESMDKIEQNLKASGIPGKPDWNAKVANKNLQEKLLGGEPGSYVEEKKQEIRDMDWTNVKGFPGMEAAIKLQKDVSKTFVSITGSFKTTKSKEFQELKKMADDKEIKYFQAMAKSPEHKDALAKMLNRLREELKETRHLENPRVPRHKLLTLANSLYVDFNEEAYDLFKQLAKKNLEERHWKTLEIQKWRKKPKNNQ